MTLGPSALPMWQDPVVQADLKLWPFKVGPVGLKSAAAQHGIRFEDLKFSSSIVRIVVC